VRGCWTARAPLGEPSIWIKHAEGKIKDGDTVYCVRIAEGQLRLFARAEVEKKGRDDDDATMLWLWTAPHGYAGWPDGRPVGDEDADRLVFLHVDGSPHHFDRRGGLLTSYAFQGPSSLRELDDGYELLDRIAGY
jgi:hypothetical protein